MQMDIFPQLVKQQFSSPILQDKEDDVTATDSLLKEMVHSPPSHSKVKCFVFVASKESHGFIGRIVSPQGYADVCRELAGGSVPLFAPVGTRNDTNAIIAADVTIGNKVQIGSESAVGTATSIADDVVIRRSIIGKRCKIGPKVKLMNSIVMDDVVIDGGSSLTNVIVCDSASLIGATLTNCIVTADGKVVNRKAEKEVI
jgi:NDP-sugar pyrophosphorylase family protein